MVLSFASVTAAAHQGSPSGDVVVVEVGEQVITQAELSEYVGNGLYSYLYPVRSEAYERALSDLVTDELKRIDLFASGHAGDSTLVRRLARNVTEELGLAYARRRYEGRYLNEETVRTEHERMGNVVSYRQIVLAKPADADEGALDSLRAVTEEIQGQLTEGVSFETLERRYRGFVAKGSTDEPLQLKWEQTVSSPRAFILFRLEPGSVQSFEGPTTFSIVRIESVEHTQVPPLDEVREQIVSALHRWHSGPATQAFKAEWMALVDSTALQWNPDALERVVSWSNMPGFFESSYQNVVDDYVGTHGDALVLTDGRGEVLLSDLPRIIAEVLTPGSSGNHDRAFIQEYLMEAVRTARLADRARADGVLEELWRADTSSPVLAREFVRYYDEQYIEDLIPAATDERLRAFYQDFADSLFYQPERVSTEIIVRSDENEIQEIWERASAGEPFETLSHRRLIRSFERTRGGDIVTRFNPEPPYLGTVAFGLDEGEISRPVSYDDARQGHLYAIVRVTERLGERQLSYDDVGERLEEEFDAFHRERIARQVANDLRARYPVEINADALDAFLDDSGDSR